MEFYKLTEEKKEKRHKEKMAIKAQFLQLLHAHTQTRNTAVQGVIVNSNKNITEQSDSMDYGISSPDKNNN